MHVPMLSLLVASYLFHFHKYILMDLPLYVTCIHYIFSNVLLDLVIYRSEMRAPF